MSPGAGGAALVSFVWQSSRSGSTGAVGCAQRGPHAPALQSPSGRAASSAGPGEARGSSIPKSSPSMLEGAPGSWKLELCCEASVLGPA